MSDDYRSMWANLGLNLEAHDALLRVLGKADPSPISGLDALLANQVFFYDNPARFTESVNKICDELGKRIEVKEGVFPQNTPRILVSGCPQAVPNWKLPMIVETAGAVKLVREV
jgi:benzoyl-CoA reductase/2-hydroxyglutaryl-CoA dehydratase subunit BcrC/BadD/HgdB